MMKIGELVRSSFNTLIKNNALNLEEVDQLLTSMVIPDITRPYSELMERNIYSVMIGMIRIASFS